MNDVPPRVGRYTTTGTIHGPTWILCWKHFINIKNVAECNYWKKYAFSCIGESETMVCACVCMFQDCVW